MGSGGTEGQETLINEPHREGLSERDEIGILWKKFPEGRSPENRLLEMLKETIRASFESCSGSGPDKLLWEMSTIWSLARLPMLGCNEPESLFHDSILSEIRNQKIRKSRIRNA